MSPAVKSKEREALPTRKTLNLIVPKVPDPVKLLGLAKFAPASRRTLPAEESIELINSTGKILPLVSVTASKILESYLIIAVAPLDGWSEFKMIFNLKVPPGMQTPVEGEREKEAPAKASALVTKKQENKKTKTKATFLLNDISSVLNLLKYINSPASTQGHIGVPFGCAGNKLKKDGRCPFF